MTYPTIRPELTLDFANSRQLDPRVTFSRTQTTGQATYLNPDTGLIAYASEHEARFEKEGLLIEESRTNTFLNSSDCALWSAFRAAVGTDTGVITAPDGSNSVGWFQNSIGTTGSRVRGGTVTASDVPSSLSVWLKARSGSPWIAVGPGQPGSDKENVFFNLSTGEQGQRGSNLVGDVDIFPWPNGWYKIVFSGVTPVNLTYALQFWAADYNGQANEDYTILSSYYCWGAQVEDAKSFPTSYIPTAGSTVIRSDDIAQITGDNFSSWYNQSEGTLLTSITPYDVTNNDYAYSFSDGTSSQRIVSIIGQTYSHYIVEGGIIQAQINYAGYTANTRTNAAATYASNSAVYATDGVIRGSDTSVIPPSVDRLVLMANRANSNRVNGHISRLSYYSRRLTDLELETLTL